MVWLQVLDDATALGEKTSPVACKPTKVRKAKPKKDKLHPPVGGKTEPPFRPPVGGKTDKLHPIQVRMQKYISKDTQTQNLRTAVDAFIRVKCFDWADAIVMGYGGRRRAKGGHEDLCGGHEGFPDTGAARYGKVRLLLFAILGAGPALWMLQWFASHAPHVSCRR